MIHLPVPTDQPLVVFTDLDGTLIDHHTYETRGSEQAMRQLAARGAPLIFCSSKTFAEQTQLQRELGICQPFILENGSAAAIPTDFFPEKNYPVHHREADYEIVEFAHAGAAVLHAVLSRFSDIRGFAGASDAELSAATGLSGAALQRARQRWYTETLLTPLGEIQAAQINVWIRPDGFVLSRGGRFYTAQSAGVDKGKAVRWMMEQCRHKFSKTPVFAAVGDSPNDRAMLEVVELPFLVQRPDHCWADMEIPGLIRVSGAGPVGFSMAVALMLEGGVEER